MNNDSKLELNLLSKLIAFNKGKNDKLCQYYSEEYLKVFNEGKNIETIRCANCLRMIEDEFDFVRLENESKKTMKAMIRCKYCKKESKIPISLIEKKI